MKKRPIGISILAVLGILGGIAILVMQIFTAKHYDTAAEYSGVSAISMLVNLTILGIWGLLSGIGMWIGKKWGWWLGATYISYSVLRNANALLTISEIVAQNPDQSIDATKYYIKHIGRVIIHSFIACYYFKANVLEFFGFPTERKWKRILAYIGATLLIFIVLATIAQVL
jgi:hypothetical protein